MFEPNASWSLPAHLFAVSEWSARMHAAQPPEHLYQQARQYLRWAASAQTGYAILPARPDADLRVDRSHLPPAQASRLVGLLRRDGQRTRLRGRHARLVRAVQQNSTYAGHLEPVALLRHREATTVNSATSSRCRTSTRGPARHAACSVMGHSIGCEQRAPAGVGERRPVLRDEPDQRGHEAVPTGAPPRSSWHGTTGGAFMIMLYRLSSTRTAMGYAFPAL